MRSFTELPQLGLYIHIPWCIKKCPYCDFNSHSAKGIAIPEQRYVDALLADLTQELPSFWGRSISSIFIGGGTPSLFSPEALDRLLSGIRALTNIASSIEITLEANPGTFEQGKFSEFKQLGINRLSIGIQSFNNTHLKALGRIHNSTEAVQATHIARAAGFERINLDLMFALPGQSPEDAKQDLLQAIELETEHLSWYQLTLEPNTLFYKHPPKLPDNDAAWEIQAQGQTLLSEAGFDQYEISAYTKNNKSCEHNLNYWRFGDYIGIGAGAHGKLSFSHSGIINRTAKTKHPEHYMQEAESKNLVSTSHEIPQTESGVEFMMNALRLRKGVKSSLFQQHTGLPLVTLSGQIKEAKNKGLLEETSERIIATELGYAHLDTLLDIFMHDDRKRVFIPVIKVDS